MLSPKSNIITFFSLLTFSIIDFSHALKQLRKFNNDNNSDNVIMKRIKEWEEWKNEFRFWKGNWRIFSKGRHT